MPFAHRRGFLRTVAALPAFAWTAAGRAQATPSRFPALEGVGKKFRMALIADTQVGPADARGVVPATSQRKMSMIVDEINALDPAPALVVFDGDQVENVEKRKVDNFLTRAKRLKPLSILVHGNHDGVYPYAEFQAMQKEMNGTDGVYFSWDVGAWHFVALPTNLPDDRYADEVLTWLEQDLLKHRDRPTMVFPHYHLMPQGLSQLEWYTYDRSFRLRCYDLFAKGGNVRYAIGGHVHNGIQTSLKTAWTFRGTNYMVAPTCTASRNFGEDFPPFAAGLAQGPHDAGGGYYLLLDFDNDQVTIQGRLVGVNEGFTFPNRFQEYIDQEPLWLADLSALPIEPTLANGSFNGGMQGWHRPFRYTADQSPGFLTRPERVDGATEQAVYLACREKGQHWARDEETEIYQRTHPPTDHRTSLGFRFRAGEMSGGGAYFRVCLFRQRELVLTLLVDWLQGRKDRNTRLGINSLYTATGKRGIPDAFIRLGETKQALFWTLAPSVGRWHQVSMDLPTLINTALGRPEAWKELAVDELLLAAGVWCLEDPGSHAEVWFDDLQWQEPSAQGIHFDDQALPIDDQVFVTDFGRETFDERLRERKKRSKPSADRAASPARTHS